MALEFARLLLGLVFVAFHRQIADFFVELDHGFVAALRSKGLGIPGPPRQSIMHTFYFCLGMFMCVFTMMKIYTTLS
ncbi:MAG: hypothetical protein NVS9B15_20570 [Acidobacteriaceae bacterium]